jgi:Cytochrome c7 and related cytochrome c
VEGQGVASRSKIRRRFLVTLGLAMLAAAAVVVASRSTHGSPQGNSQENPQENSKDNPQEITPAKETTVAFDHAIHAGEYSIACLGCHVYADKSSSAGIPSARMCMGCHKFVAKDKPGVQALAALFEQGEAPRWQRVTRLPDFIYFSHRMHVRKNVECRECHGDVKAMHVVEPAVKLNMGFCIDCHDKKEATVECTACHK